MAKLMVRRDDASGASAEAERLTSEREAHRLAEEWRLCSGVLLAYAPAGAAPGADDGLVLASGVPWWCSHLAVMSSGLCGFAGHRPWTPRALDFGVSMFGTRSAVDAAQSLYAAARFAVAGMAHRCSLPAEVDEYLLGVAVAVGADLAQEAQTRAQAEARANRCAMIVRPAESAPAVDMARAQQDPNSPLRRGMAAGRGLGGRALGKRPAPVRTFTWSTSGTTGAW